MRSSMRGGSISLHIQEINIGVKKSFEEEVAEHLRTVQ